MKVCTIVVTYGNRFQFLDKVVNACFEEGVDKIIIIDNASEKESKQKLKQLETRLKEKIKVVCLNKNTGSAGGYKRGLEEACKDKQCEFIWLLDDDNMPQKGSLKILKEFWNKLKDRKKREQIALLSFRPDREIFKKSVLTNSDELILGKKNSFMGFHFFKIFEKIFNRKSNLIKRNKKDIKFGVVPVAPYGGLFFHRELLKVIDFPDSSFFVYGDDYDFTIKIPKIYILFESKIIDLEKSFHLNRSFQTRVFKAGNCQQVYYMVRNNVVFQNKNNLIENKIVYLLNMIIYLLLNISLIPFNLDRKPFVRIKALLKGVVDGFKKTKS